MEKVNISIGGLLFLVLATGCAPSIDDLEVSDTNDSFPPEQGVGIEIRAEITEKNTEMETPIVSIKTPFQSDSDMFRQAC